MNNLYTIFADRTKKNKKRISIVDVDGEHTYEELLELVTSIQNKLLDFGICSGDKVGILCKKDIYWVASFLAIWSIDATAVTLSVRDSIEQIQERMRQVKCSYVLTNEKNINFKGTIFIKNQNNKEQDKFFKTINYENEISCIMFTSGSTGQPKAVAVGHNNILNLIDNKCFEFINEKTTLLQTGAANFDAIHFEIWCPLFKGGKVLVFSENTILNSISFNSIVSEYSPNLMWLTSPLFTNMIQSGKYDLGKIDNLVIGGDRLNSKAIQKTYYENPNIKIYNGYGPTETTTFATFYQIPNTNIEENIPLGETLENVKIQIENSEGKNCMVDEVGEIVIYGLGVACGGYLGESTSKGFIKNKGKSIGYRTGDLGKIGRDNLIYYFGRKDSQVKVNGYRIDINQVERIFLNIVGVKNAVVFVEDNKGQVELKAVIQLDLSYQKTIDEIMAEFQKKKPAHIIISSIQCIEKIPLKNNGKIDIDKIKEYFIHNLSKFNVNTLEEIHNGVKTIIYEILNEKFIADDESFFTYGIDSLKASLIAAKLNNYLSVNITIWDILDNDTIEYLTSYIMSKLSENKLISVKNDTSDDEKVNEFQKPYYLDFLRNHNSIKYNIPLLLELPNSIDIERLSNVLIDVVNSIESLHLNFFESQGQFFQKKRSELLTNIPIYKNTPSRNEWIRPFDLEKDCLYRIAIVIEKRPKLLLDFHHIVMDGKMLQFFLTLVEVEYKNKGDKKLSTYLYEKSKDFSYRQEDIEKLKNRIQHYQKNKGVLPVDFPCERIVHSKGESVKSIIASDIWNEFKEKALDFKVTHSVLLSAAFSMFLHFITDSDEVIYNVPVNCKYLEENQFYMSTTTVLQTSTINNVKTFYEYIFEFSKNYYDNIELNIPAHILGTYISNPDFRKGLYSTDTLFSYHSESELEIDWFDKKINIRPSNPGQSMLPLNLQVFEINDSLMIEFEYEATLFDKISIEFYLDLFVNIIKEFSCLPKDCILKEKIEQILMNVI